MTDMSPQERDRKRMSPEEEARRAAREAVVEPEVGADRTFPSPMPPQEREAMEAAFRAYYPGQAGLPPPTSFVDIWVLARDYSKQREEELARELQDAEARELAVRRIVRSNAEELRISYRDAMNERVAEAEQQVQKLREALAEITAATPFAYGEVNRLREIARAALAENGEPKLTPRYCSQCCMYVPAEREPHLSRDIHTPHYADCDSEEQAITDLKHLSNQGDDAAQERREKIEAQRALAENGDGDGR